MTDDHDKRSRVTLTYKDPRGGGGGAVTTVTNTSPAFVGGGGGGVSRNTADEFMRSYGMTPTPDAMAQLIEVFVPCLKIMCERGYDPNGKTWRRAGRLGALADMRKKFMRLWEHAWMLGGDHPDSAYDLINYTGFYVRAGNTRWGEWGEPGDASE